jgi:hypothetical protein
LCPSKELILFSKSSFSTTCKLRALHLLSKCPTTWTTLPIIGWVVLRKLSSRRSQVIVSPKQNWTETQIAKP